MPLTNIQLCHYDSNVLRLPADKRTEYYAQVDRLIAELSRSLRDKTEIKITKVVNAGSFAKFTILRKTSTDPVDVPISPGGTSTRRRSRASTTPFTLC